MTAKDDELVCQGYVAVLDDMLALLSPEERLATLERALRHHGFTPALRLQGLTAEEILRAIPPEVREQLAKKLNR
ncbi:hypothetical protein [Sorangium sp. So ce131]|uniref:hypothetical protein n=1 Tax=Sorangium sp. So ce131 TaxID=3133282 RepID=UPI003F6396CD